MQSIPPKPIPFQFSLRKILLATALIAFFVGWYNSLESVRNENQRLTRRLVNAKMQMQHVESRVKFRSDRTPSLNPSTKGVLSEEELEGMNLRGIVLQSDAAAFQLTKFDHSDLTDSSLTGGHASFQGASFHDTLLKNAKLKGGASSFQLASFVNADLSGAFISGNLQMVSLANAKCIGATIQGSFQGANIDATQFQDADLSAIDGDNLVSCYFDTPPKYNSKTRFPTDFDPVKNGWKSE